MGENEEGRRVDALSLLSKQANKYFSQRLTPERVGVEDGEGLRLLLGLGTAERHEPGAGLLLLKLRGNSQLLGAGSKARGRALLGSAAKLLLGRSTSGEGGEGTGLGLRAALVHGLEAELDLRLRGSGTGSLGLRRPRREGLGLGSGPLGLRGSGSPEGEGACGEEGLLGGTGSSGSGTRTSARRIPRRRCIPSGAFR